MANCLMQIDDELLEFAAKRLGSATYEETMRTAGRVNSIWPRCDGLIRLHGSGKFRGHVPSWLVRGEAGQAGPVLRWFGAFDRHDVGSSNTREL